MLSRRGSTPFESLFPHALVSAARHSSPPGAGVDSLWTRPHYRARKVIERRIVARGPSAREPLAESEQRAALQSAAVGANRMRANRKKVSGTHARVGPRRGSGPGVFRRGFTLLE